MRPNGCVSCWVFGRLNWTFGQSSRTKSLLVGNKFYTAEIAAYGVVLTRTLSNVAVADELVLWLVTASPTSTVPEIDSVSLPTTVHERPSAESDAVMTPPFRDSFTQRGADPEPPYVFVEVPPVTVRR